LAAAEMVSAVVATQRDMRPVVMAGCWDNVIRVWDVQTGQREGQSWSGHRGGVVALAAGQVNDRAVVVSLGGSAAGDQLAVPAQDGGRGDEQPEASADREQSVEGSEQGARSVPLIRRRGVRRWSTASWWRRTRISISLVSDRVSSTIQPRSLENIW
jgi:hypothetical protein